MTSDLTSRKAEQQQQGETEKAQQQGAGKSPKDAVTENQRKQTRDLSKQPRVYLI